MFLNPVLSLNAYIEVFSETTRNAILKLLFSYYCNHACKSVLQA